LQASANKPSVAAFAGDNPTLDYTPAGEPVVYSPIFTTLVTDGLIPNLFSLAIERDVTGQSGYLAFGGLPPVSYTGDFASTPILITNFEQFQNIFAFYTINIDSIQLHGEPLPNTGGPSNPYIVDSGTTLNYFPTSAANAFNAAFDPPAVFSDTDGFYYVDCNAKKPALDIIIGGTKFDTNPLDLILYLYTDANGKDVCQSGVNDGGSVPGQPQILGSTFLKNVVAVFDVGAGEMRFAAHEHYVSNDPY
jgi:Eukaryotic aspartyl protease